MALVSNHPPFELHISSDNIEAPHWHTWPELLLVLEGNAILTEQGTVLTLPKNGIAVVNAFTVHAVEHTGQLLCLSLRSDRMAALLNEPLDYAFACNTATMPDNADYALLRGTVARYCLSVLQPVEPIHLLQVTAALDLLVLLITSFSRHSLPPRQDVAISYLQQATDFMTANFQRPIRTRDIAAHCGLSATYLSHLFGLELGMAPSKYLNTMRLDHAKELLNRNGLNLSEIAEQCGFTSLRNFSAAFQKQFGILPREYRKQPMPESGLSAPPAAAVTAFRTMLDTSPTDQLPVNTLLLPPVSLLQQGKPMPEAPFRVISYGAIDRLLMAEEQRKLRVLQQKGLQWRPELRKH